MNLVDRLEAFAGRRVALALMGLWAAAEAVALPVVPDVGLCLLALAAPRRGARLLAAVMVGALIGSVMLAALAVASPDVVRAMLLGLPGIDAAVVADVEARVSTGGVVAFAQFGPGPPLKVYTDAWVAQGGDIGGVILGTILNRVTRIGPVVVVAAVVGMALGSWVRRRDRLTVLTYVAVWIVFYAIYLG